jgi:hypothetical protein
MKRLILIGLLVAGPAVAQIPTASQTQRATEIMLSREMTAHQADLAAAVQQQDQITDLNAKLTAVTKERDDLKAKEKPPEPSK